MTVTGTPIETLLEQESWAKRLAWDLARGDGALADDLVQGAYAAALARPPSLGVPVRRWFARVMRNLARHERRGQANRTAVEQYHAHERRNEAAAANAAAVLEIRRQLQGVVEELAEPYRTRVIERYVEGLKPGQIAARAGTSVDTVKSQIARGLDRLRATLDRMSGGDRSKWMAAFAPLLRSRRGTFGALHGHSTLVGIAASAAVFASAVLAARHFSSTSGAHAAATGSLATAAHDAVRDTLSGDEHRAVGPRQVAAAGSVVAPDTDPNETRAEEPPAASARTLWEVLDGNRRRGVVWNNAGTELAVVNYSTQQVEIWSANGGVPAFSKSALHLSEIAWLGGTIWATHPGGQLACLEVATLRWMPSSYVGDPGGHWLVNGIGVDRFGRIHVARAGDGTIQVFDSAGGSDVGQWTGVPEDVQLLAIDRQLFALGYSQLDGSSAVAIGSGYSEDLESFKHSRAIRLLGGLTDLQFLADGSLVCLIEHVGLLRFQRTDSAWAFAGFMAVPACGSRAPSNCVERFSFGGPGDTLLALGHELGLQVVAAGEWESSGERFDAATQLVVDR